MNRQGFLPVQVFWKKLSSVFVFDLFAGFLSVEADCRGCFVLLLSGVLLEFSVAGGK